MASPGARAFTGAAACPECDREYQVADPKGYTFRERESDDDNGEDDEDDVDPTAPGMGRRTTTEAEALIRHFLDRYAGRRGPVDGRSAMDAFRESYKDGLRDGRLPLDSRRGHRRRAALPAGVRRGAPARRSRRVRKSYVCGCSSKAETSPPSAARPALWGMLVDAPTGQEPL